MKKAQDVIGKNDLNFSLQKEFRDAMEDDDFLIMLTKYDIKEDVGKKYTTKLIECSRELANCKNCKGLGACRNAISGFVLTPKISGKVINFSYVGCHYKKCENYKDNIVLFDVPKEIKQATLSNVYTNDANRIEILKKIKSYYDNYFTDKKDKGIYLHGSFGTGKTYLLSALLNELAKKDVKSIIVHVPELIRSLKESFDSDYKEKFNLLKNVPILLLDDIGSEYLTPWARDEVLVPLLNYRMNEKLPTFFTSNLDMKSLEDHFVLNGNSDKLNAQRLMERIRNLSVEVELTSKNIRG